MTSLKRELQLKEWGIAHRLYSYYYILINPAIIKIFTDNIKNNRFKIMLDSGAHSWSMKNRDMVTKGDLLRTKEFKKYMEAYFQFLDHYKDKVEIYITLDLIGNGRQSWDMQKRMERMGFNPLPVFHWGESKKWLRKYQDNYEYFGISGLGRFLTKRRYLEWADSVFSEICGRDGLPKWKIHGFSVSSDEPMKRYPWYSIDHTTYFKTGRNGKVHFHSGVRDYRVFLSNRDKEKMAEHSHLSSWRTEERERVEAALKKYGVTLEEAMTDGYKRDEVNCKYFVEVEKNWKPKLFFPKVKGFFE